MRLTAIALILIVVVTERANADAYYPATDDYTYAEMTDVTAQHAENSGLGNPRWALTWAWESAMVAQACGTIRVGEFSREQSDQVFMFWMDIATRIMDAQRWTEGSPEFAYADRQAMHAVRGVETGIRPPADECGRAALGVPVE